MIFNDFAFVFLFLPVVLILFFLPLLSQHRHLILLISSFVFYGASGLEHFLCLFISITWVYIWTRNERVVGNRAILIIAIAIPLGLLFYYKYLGFFLRNVLGLTGALDESFDLFDDILLPAGISFFTFQLISFAIDRYRGEHDVFPTYAQLALYISFFPQLVAGPIVRFSQVSQAIANLAKYRLKGEDATAAIGYITLGLAAKVLLADSLSNLIAPMAAAPDTVTGSDATYIVFAYSFQIYFDFYGYSLIAIGLGRLFGFRLPINFDRPYSALNPREFWRRWHMTLSYWLRDYLYVPLGGNRHYIRNILVVFALCGLWHGAGWNFIIWGLYHAALVAGYRLCHRGWDRMPALLQVVCNFSLVSVGWLLFLFEFGQLRSFVKALITFDGSAVELTTPEHWVILLVAATICFAIRFETIITATETADRGAIPRAFALATLFVFTLLFFDRSQDFIYFRF
jgi:alginate O-acetyltransferase complex protein AlgI